MKVTRYSFRFTLIFTISLVMMISGITDALGGQLNITPNCTLENLRHDKKIERDEPFTITWNNPDTKNCRYDVSFYYADKSDAGELTGYMDSVEVTWDTVGTKYFKICPTSVNDCKSPFYIITVEDGSGNIMFIILGIVVAIVISIAFVSKKNTRKKSPTSSTAVPSSTEVPSSTPVSTKKSQKESITDIDKQIAINEEKIRKMEEESKRLDEED